MGKKWFKDINKIFLSSTSIEEDIVSAGENIFAKMYGLKDTTLRDARYEIYLNLLHKKANVQKDLYIYIYIL